MWTSSTRSDISPPFGLAAERTHPQKPEEYPCKTPDRWTEARAPEASAAAYLVIGQKGNSNQDFQSNRLTVALSRLKSPASQARQDGRIEAAVRSLQYRETLELAFDVHDSKDDDYVAEIRSNQLRIQSGQFLGQGKWRRDSFRVRACIILRRQSQAGILQSP